MSRRVRITRSWNWWPINRPRLWAAWFDNDAIGLDVSWGNGNSDPVWMIGVEVRQPPRWLAWIVDRLAS